MTTPEAMKRAKLAHLQRRKGAGYVETRVLLPPEVNEALVKLVGVYGSKQKAVEAAIVALTNYQGELARQSENNAAGVNQAYINARNWTPEEVTAMKARPTKPATINRIKPYEPQEAPPPVSLARTAEKPPKGSHGQEKRAGVGVNVKEGVPMKDAPKRTGAR